MKKELYTQPTAEIFKLRLGSSVLQNGSETLGKGGIQNIPSGSVIGDDNEYE